MLAELTSDEPSNPNLKPICAAGSAAPSASVGEPDRSPLRRADASPAAGRHVAAGLRARHHAGRSALRPRPAGRRPGRVPARRLSVRLTDVWGLLLDRARRTGSHTRLHG